MKHAISRKFIESLHSLESILEPNSRTSYENKIRLDLENKVLVATNGHALAQHSVIPTDLELFKESIGFTFTKDALKTLLKDKKNTNFYIDMDEHVDKCIFGTPSTSCVALCDSYYPKYEAVIPDPGKYDIEFCIDFNILQDLVSAMERNNTSKRFMPITFKLQSEATEQPIIVRHGDASETDGKKCNVIMGRKLR